MQPVVSVLAKTLCGGILVLLFAGLSEAFTPKRFAGILSAAPAVAIAGLAVGAIDRGPASEALAAHSMIAGAVALVACAAIAAVVIPKRGLAMGASLACVGWLAVAAVVAAALL